ncbi:MAG: GNAT family N-acetyltransferase [Clostridia bacterium]|nr:GNAT family N-acetyltransferase [Clostridia bacterium]MBQ9951402.1 GNAT family N-acetyltransferase [Clostridia bacterium]
MKHVGTQVIETERLILRPVVREDAPAMHRNWTGDPEVTKYLTWPTHASVNVTEGFAEYLLQCYQDPKNYGWCIVLKDESPEPIGMISVVDMNEAAESVHIGYCLGQNWWGRGVMTEALGAVIDFAFNVLGANRVDARHDPRNPASGAVMRKCGMVYEGTHRQSDRNNQGICDAAWYSILKADSVR